MKSFLLLISAAVLAGCSLGVDFAGFFSSYSTPDSRFEEKDDLPYHSDMASLEALSLTAEGYFFNIAVISDIHVKDDAPRHLEQFVDSCLSPDDIAILDCGDSTQSGYDYQFLSYKTVMDRAGIPWFAAIGNHDLYFEGWKSYRTMIGRSVYSVGIGEPGNRGSTLLIALDSANGTLGMKQLNWLKDLLSEQKDRWDHLVIFTHSQFFSTGVNTVVQFTDTEEIYFLMHLFETNGVDLVLMGHNHIWDDRKIKGVQYLTLDPLIKEGSEDSFVRITVTGADLTWERVMISGY
ncbi:MAG: metallophosphoesterase [Spirochaetales bacterium]|nr:metallophosphoesterase [Spirochaetales bacterium]